MKYRGKLDWYSIFQRFNCIVNTNYIEIYKLRQFPVQRVRAKRAHDLLLCKYLKLSLLNSQIKKENIRIHR